MPNERRDQVASQPANRPFPSHSISRAIRLPSLQHTLFESFLNDLFFKICGAGETTIAWDQFATYMLLEYQKKDDTYRRSKRVCQLDHVYKPFNEVLRQILAFKPKSESEEKPVSRRSLGTVR